MVGGGGCRRALGFRRCARL